MTRDVNAEIIAIGTEILLGEITDTNSVFIARTLRDIGVNLYFMTSVGDNEGRIADAIRIALERAQIVITCGGLGPTIDDMTRQAVAAATNRGLTFHQHLLDKIAERFVGFRTQMTENNRRQAYVPDGAIIIENPVGTAPCFVVEQGEQCVISLPGVPREMKFLFVERVVPYLRERYELGGKIIKARVLRTAGIGESMLDDAIGVDLLQASNPTVGLAAHSGQVDVRITAKADSEAEADAMIAQIEASLRERIGDYIFGIDTDTIEDALIRTLHEQQATLAISETGIAPIISERLKTHEHVDSLLVDGWHFDDAETLARTLDVSEISLRQLAEVAAQRQCQQSGATLAIAIVSRSGTEEDRADSDEMSALSVYCDGKMRSRAYGFGGGTDVARLWSSTWAMSMAWRMLRERVE
jgi:competence/damage-inducible protein CinA-like protein